VPPSFAGFPPEMIRFFRGLERNNNREWFQKHKDTYESAVKQPMIALVDAVNRELFRFAPAYITDPKRAIYRIYRDTRFSPDKTPYKTHSGALMSHRGFEKNHGASLYFSVSHKEVEVAAGVYMPEADELRSIRQHVAAHHKEFRALTANRKLVAALGQMQGEQLSRAPKGFASDDPAADLVRYKQFLFYTLLPADVATTARLFKEIVTRLELLIPFVDFLNAAKRVKRQDKAFLA
jgi:uncharacterized protein (TIGR02453 family)